MYIFFFYIIYSLCRCYCLFVYNYEYFSICRCEFNCDLNVLGFIK